VTVPPASALHPGLGRFEAFDIARERLAALGVHAACTRLPWSVHAPLTRARLAEPPSAVFFLAESPRRAASFAALEATLAGAARLGAEYVVTHLNWTEDVADRGRAEALAHDAAARIAGLARRHGVPVHVEIGGYTGGFHEAAQFAALARAHPDLGLCLDVGHLWLIAAARGRPAYRDIETLAPHARSLHLWAARDLATYRAHGHLPLAPDLSPADGWLDVRRALAPVLAARPDCAVIFEYAWPRADARRALAGLAWAEDLVRGVAH
jgi:sugar phosphate isomerase/epimerase